ncbi:Glycopeptide antibiotics resistance protein [Halobacillus alkaliphilus]|uniref:Glycopeptide antibiotics resistance protein n=1 Tax=Halobacillus alkaliphilus TaxID=396056 RepID=A0A1I2KGX2_9BACI|nr:VanZ family protein [Halobacillus alkaliphilus]SFF64371.1 Glycopeptide antibiotics resistance protein [Halobacillus alkaliphilus]
MQPLGISYDLTPPLFLIVFIVICGITFLYLHFKKKKKNFKKLFLFGATIFYVVSVIKLTLLPITVSFKEGVFPDLASSDFYNLVPFQTISQALSYGNYVQVFGNIALLFPLHILLGLLRGKVLSFFKSLLLLIVITLTIELTQLIINLATGIANKVIDIDDFILNVFGGLVGWFLSKAYIKFFTNKESSQENLQRATS